MFDVENGNNTSATAESQSPATGSADRSRSAPPDTPALQITDLTVAYSYKPVLWDIDLELPAGQMTAIIGPNGAGKSTLIKAVLGLIPTASGSVKVLGQTLAQARRQVGYVPQREAVDWDFPISVREVVLMGRYGRLGWLRRPGQADRAAADHALSQVGLNDFADRQISQLSGGQQQRVFLARALAQQADLYFMDEPFASVDAATEAAIVRVLEDLRAAGKTVIVVHHDLQTVREYFNYVVMLNMRLVAAGPMEETFTPTHLRRAYGSRLPLLTEVSDVVAREELPVTSG